MTVFFSVELWSPEALALLSAFADFSSSAGQRPMNIVRKERTTSVLVVGFLVTFMAGLGLG